MTNYFRAAYYLFTLMRHVYWDRQKLKALQEKKLRRIVRYAYDHVPYYRERLRDLGIKPADIRTVEDLNKLPILRKDELRSNLGKMISDEVDIKSLVRLKTSGSTGRPLVLYVSLAEDEFRKAKHLRANISCGQKPRDRWVVISLPTRFESVGKFQRKLGVYAPSFISVFDDTFEQLLSVERMQPDILDGYSSPILLLGKEMEKKGLEKVKPRMIFSGAELIDDYSRRFIEKVFDCPLYDQYAATEFERLAWQCPAKIGYHIDVDATILQFIDENEEEVSVGESGEIVCTSLFNYAMPLIRYAVGDVGVPTDEECSCGRTLPLMKVVEGRKGSFILLPDRRMLSPINFCAAMDLFKMFEYIDRWRVVQKKRDHIEICVKKAGEAVEERILEIELVAHLKKSLNLENSEIAFEVKFVDDIPLDKSGKLMAVTSELTNESIL